MKQERKFTLTVTETQLNLICECVEDCHRFMAGESELHNMTSRLDEFHKIWNKLKDLQPLITPQLPYNATYGWSGHDCPNDAQRKFIAQTYPIYREILHFFATLDKKKDDSYSVYESETLTCEEGGIPPKIELVKP